MTALNTLENSSTERTPVKETKKAPPRGVLWACRLSPLLGIVFFAFYKILIKRYCVFSLFPARDKVGMLVVSYSFTLMGILVAALSIIAGIQGYRVNRFKSNGYYDCLASLIFWTTLTLIGIFISGILMLAKSKLAPFLFSISMMLTFSSIIQIPTIILITTNLFRKK